MSKNNTKSLELRLAHFLLLCIAACLLFCRPALAADEKSNGGFFDNISKTASQVVMKAAGNVTEGMYQAGKSFAEKLKPLALSFGGSIALVYLMFQMIKLVTERNGSLVDVLLEIGVPAVMAAALITNYSDHMDRFNVFLEGMRNIAPDPLQGIAKFYAEILALIENSIRTSIKVLITASIFDDGFMAKALDVLAVIIFSLVIVFIAINGLSEVLGIILMGPFLFSIGVAFGPMPIAAIVTPWTREYFGKWLGFVVGAAVLSGVVGVVVSIAATLLEHLNISSYATGVPISITLATSGIMIMAVNSLISQAPGIATALVPGGIGVRQGTAQAVAAAAKSSSGMAKSVAKLPKTAAGKFVGMGKSAVSLARSARGKSAGGGGAARP